MTQKIEEADLAKLRELHDSLRLKNAKVAVAQAELDLLLANLYIKNQANNQTQAICLWCGAFVSRAQGCACAQE